MRLSTILLLVAGLALFRVRAELVLRPTRSAPTDLEVAGPLPGGRTNGFLTRDQLLALPLTLATNALDTALKSRAVYRGIPLVQLRSLLGLDGGANTLFAVCSDGYAKAFEADYLEAFQSLLILEINGGGPETWGRSKLTGLEMSPYYINATDFAPRAGKEVLGLPEDLHFPYSVVRLEFRTADSTVDRLRLPATASTLAKQGGVIAVRDCLACHGHADFGGTMSGRPWLLLKTWSSNTNYFRRYVVKPRSIQPFSRMPGFTHYEPGVLDALQAYFRELKLEDLRR
jgi:hypothetical protein